MRIYATKQKPNPLRSYAIGIKEKFIRIGSTPAMDTIWVSENLREKVAQTPGMEILGEAREMTFDENGDLFR